MIEVVKPGDVLIIGIGEIDLSDQQAHEMACKLKETLPGVSEVVLVPGATSFAAYRPDRT